MSNTTYYQRNKDVILNRAKDYYENDQKRLRKQENTEIYQKKRKMKRENMEKTDIIRPKEYQKNYGKAKTSQSNQ